MRARAEDDFSATSVWNDINYIIAPDSGPEVAEYLRTDFHCRVVYSSELIN